MCTWSPNKLWRSNSIYSLWSDRKFAMMPRLGRAVPLPATGCDVEGKCRHRTSDHRERPRPLGLVFLFNLFKLFTCNFFSWASTFHRNLFCHMMIVRNFLLFMFLFYLFLSSLLYSVAVLQNQKSFQTQYPIKLCIWFPSFNIFFNHIWR